MSESALGLEAFLATAILLLYTLIGHSIEVHRITWIHESGVAILLGIFAGGIMYYAADTVIRFNDAAFFYFILPPIIFAAGYNLKKRSFFRNIGAITAYGVIGTVITCTIITAIASLLSSWHWIIAGARGSVDLYVTLRPIDCMFLAAVLSSTDTVAALSLVKEDQHPKLNSIVFGEGVVNDAISILLFRTIDNYVGAKPTDSLNLDYSATGMIFLQFVYLTVASLAIGIVVGLISSRLLKITPSLKDHPWKETSIIFLVGYMSYIIAELLDLSGIMTLFFCGVTIGHYGFYNISEKARQTTSISFNSISHVAEAFLFAYLGLTVYAYGGQDWAFGFIFLMILAIMIARGVSLISMNLFYYFATCRRVRAKFSEVAVVWFSGLIRGAIAFALILQVPSAHYRGVLVTTTLGICLVTTLFFGAAMPAFIRMVGIKSDGTDIPSSYVPLLSDQHENNQDVYESIDENGNNGTADSSVRTRSDSATTKLHGRWRQFDDRYLKPFFGGSESDNPENRSEVSSNGTPVQSRMNEQPLYRSFSAQIGSLNGPNGLHPRTISMESFQAPNQNNERASLMD
eukprot:GILK01010556.1.p1 GENE.GILK01010556.1~~GILK01010556.1.p1  ORF type:complete len:586 (-),score=83.02 GILK01010556.1:269-1987(-)